MEWTISIWNSSSIWNNTYLQSSFSLYFLFWLSLCKRSYQSVIFFWQRVSYLFIDSIGVCYWSDPNFRKHGIPVCTGGKADCLARSVSSSEHTKKPKKLLEKNCSSRILSGNYIGRILQRKSICWLATLNCFKINWAALVVVLLFSVMMNVYMPFLFCEIHLLCFNNEQINHMKMQFREYQKLMIQ